MRIIELNRSVTESNDLDAEKLREKMKKNKSLWSILCPLRDPVRLAFYQGL